MLERFRAWRRHRVLERAEFPDELWRDVTGRLPFLQGLSEQEAARLRELAILFVHDKTFRGVAGLEVTDEMKLVIAAQACLLILDLGIDCYRGWTEIIVYPAEFLPRHEYVDEAGVVHVTDEPMAGEAWLHGPVVLSWQDAERSGEFEGINVVIHEFAHKLDMLNGGDTNGFPPLREGMDRRAWARDFRAAYEDFRARVDAGEETWIDPYASENAGEFFAVLSETFFEAPDILFEEYPAAYRQLGRFYGQDPLARWEELSSNAFPE